MAPKSHLVKLFVKVIDSIKLPPLRQRGRPLVYPPLVILKCTLVMVYYRLTSLRSLERFLHQHLGVAQACGLTHRIPCYRTFARRFQTLESPATQAAWKLLRRLIRRRWIRLMILATDASLLAAKGRSPKGRSPDKRTSDREAVWGYSSVDKSWLWGYKLHLISTVRPCMAPLLWHVTRANLNEGRHLSVLLKQKTLWSRKRPWCLADRAYDSRRNVTFLQKHRLRLVTPIKGNRWPPSHMKGDRQKRLKLFKRWCRDNRFKRLRADIERLLGQLKEVFLLDPLPLKGLKNVQTYIALVLLAYLAGIAYNGSMHRGLRAIKSLVA